MVTYHPFISPRNGQYAIYMLMWASAITSGGPTDTEIYYQ